LWLSPLPPLSFLWIHLHIALPRDIHPPSHMLSMRYMRVIHYLWGREGGEEEGERGEEGYMHAG